MLIKEDFPLKSLCTFGIGGPAKFLLLPKNNQEIIEAFEFAQEKKLKPFLYGGGSNILFPDEGLNTVVIKVNSKQITLLETGFLQAEAGVTWTELARFCLQNNLYGLEALYGLPGTVGGAVYGNAGCHGLETKDILVSITIFDTKSADLSTKTVDHLEMKYRTTNLKAHKDLIVLSAQFRVSLDPSDSSGDPSEHSQERKLKQPTGLTTGSFFKNPKNDFAGRLIEEAGLKGFKINGIQVSDKHANFFMNDGTATSKDVIALKNHIQQVIFDKYQIKLEPEVQIVESQDW